MKERTNSMTALDQLLQALNKRPIFETFELKEDLKPHIPYLIKDPETFQKLLQEIEKSETIKQLKDALYNTNFKGPNDDLINIFNNLDYYLAGPYKDEDNWELHQTLYNWCDDGYKIAKAKCKKGETPFSYYLNFKPNQSTTRLLLLTPSLFRELILTEDDIINIYDRYDILEDIQTIIDSDPEDLTNTSEIVQQFYQALQIMVENGSDVSPIHPIFQKLKEESL